MAGIINSPTSGTWGSSIVGTYDVPGGTIDVVTYQGATFGNGGPIAVLDGPGTLESSGSASVNQFGGNVQLQIGGGITWSNGGTIDQSGAMQFGTAAADSATLINLVGAIYDLTSGNSQLYVNGAGSYNFINNGLLEMTGGSSDTLQAALTNSGVVSADNGNFYLSGGVTNSGTLQSDGGFLEIQGGVLGGTIQALSGDVGLVGTYTIAGTIGTVAFNDANLGWFGDGEATFAGPGTLVSLGNVHVSQFGGNNQLALTGGVTWDNNGTVYQDGAIVLGIGTNDSATIVNLSGAVYDLTSGNSQLGVGNPGTYGFVNAGLLEMTGGGGNTLSMPLDNTGLVSAQNGNLYLGGMTTNSGTLQSDQGNLILYGGTLGGLIEDSSTNGADVFLTGTYAVPADTTDSVIFGGVYFGWGSGGGAVLAGPGTLVSNGLINTYQNGGNVQLQLTGGMTWANAGTVNQMGAVQLGTAAGDTATIVNQAGATYELTGGNSQIYGNGTGTYNFINAGLLEIVGGSTDTIYVNLTNTGLVSADNGDLFLAGPVSSSGTLEANGGQLFVEGGTLGGLIRVNPQNGGNVYLIGTYTVAAGPADDVAFGGVYFGDANAAALTGPGTLVSGGSVNVYQFGGDIQLLLEGGVTWENTGTVNQNGAVQFVANAGTGATIINQAGALYELTSGNSQITASGAGPVSFVNQGTLEMIGGGNNDVSVPLTNTGLLSADNGNLIVNAGFSNTGTMQADGGTLFLTGGTLGGTIQALAGNVYLQGTFSLPANVAAVTFGGATLGDATEAVLTGPGTLTTTGSVNVYQFGGDTQLLLQSAITWDNAGTVNQNGVVEFGAGAGDSATVVNQANAVWQLTSGNAQISINGTGSYNYVNAGTFEMLGGGNDHIAVAFSNAGLVTTNGGGLYFDGPIANSGTLLTEGGGMQLAGGTLGGAILASNGGITLLGTYAAAAGTTDTVTFGGATFGNGNIATLAGPGTIASGGSVNVDQFGGDVELVLTGGVTWQNAGVVNQNGALEFGAAAGDTATIVNEAGAVYELTSGNAQIYGDGAGSYTFVNAGLLEMVGGGTNNIAAAIDETATGTITNTTGNLNFNAGGTIAGLVTGNQSISFSGNVLLASTGDITASTVNFNAGDVVMQGGDVDSSNLTIASGVTAVGYGTIGYKAIVADPVNDGVIDATGGLLTVNGAITGSGSLQVETGATLDIAGTTAQNVTFDGIDATLQLGSPSGFSGAIAGFGAGDTIDFQDEVLNHVSIASGYLVGTLSTGGTMSIAAPGVASGLQLSYGSDGDGGTDVSLAPASTTAIPQVVTVLGGDNSIVLPDVHVASVGGSAGTFSDSLESGINPAFWSATLENPPFYTDSTGPNGVTFEKAGNSTPAQSIQDAGLNLNLAALGGDIAGNFSVTVSFEDAAISGGGLDQVELHTSYSDGNIFFDSRSQQGGSGDAHVWNGNTEGSVATNGATNGTFTIARVGDVISGYYDGTLIYSETESADLTAVGFTLQNNEGSDDNTAVTFNDFSITASSVPASSGTPDEENVAIANAATGSADGLNVAVGTATGDAFGSGSIAALAPGATDDTSIAAGLNDTTAGSQSGSVALDFQSDGSVSGNVANLGDETLNLSGNVYAYASPSISAPTNVILHTGDDGGTATEALTVANTAPADGFSEGLDAAATGAVTGNLLSATGTTPDIAAGSSDDSSITVSFSTQTAGAVSGDVAVAETSDGTGVDTLGTTALGAVDVPVTVTINNYATAAVEQAGGPGALSLTGNTYTLNLGAVAIGPGAVSDTLDIANTAAGPADWLSGSLGASGASAFNDSGLGAFGALSAGGTTPLTVALATTNSGTFEQTITLTPTDSNEAGFNEALAAETIDVVGTVLPNTELAQATINEPSPIVLRDVHVASLVADDQTTLNISNTGSDTLSGAVVTASGNAYASGSFSGLAPDGTDSTDITAGLNNTSAGAKSGSVTLAFNSGSSDVALPTQIVSLTGAVYSYATAAITGQSNAIVHVGQGGGSTTATLNVANSAATGGFSENLDATAVGTSGAVTGASGSVSEIAAGASNSTALSFTVSDATAGTVTGDVAVATTSDGTGVDTLGTTALGTVDVPVSVTVNNYATAAIEQSSGPGALTQAGSVYTLNLGSFAQGTGNVASGLAVANTATGPADALSGSLSANGDSAFTGYDPSDTAALSVTYFEVSDSGNGPDFGTGQGSPNVAIGGTLGPDGLPIVSSPAGVADVDASTQELTWWDPSLNSGVVETGTGIITLPYSSNMYAPDSTGPNDATYFETAILQGTFSLSAVQSVQFDLTSDDDSFIYVDGTLIGANPGIHGSSGGTFTASDLAVGTHTVEVFYDDRQQSGADLALNVLTPGVTIAPANPSGLGAFGNVAAGSSSPFSIDMSTANTGVFTETVTLAASGTNAAGYSGVLPSETLVVTGTVLASTALANPVINGGTTVVLPDAHVAAVPNDQTTLSISNTGSAVLGAVVSGATGNAYGGGQITQLAVGGTDTSDITVGLNNTSAGAKSGSVTLAFSSGGDNLLADGSFEDASDFVNQTNDSMLLSPGSTILQSWTVVGGSQIGWYGPTSSYNGPAAEDGSYYLDLTGYTDNPPYGGVSQTIATTVGAEYELSFWLGSSSTWGTPDSLTASAGGTSETFTSTLTGSNNWQLETLDFTATGTATAISLVGTSPAHQYIGLDNVVVASLSAPTPIALDPQTVAVSGNVFNYATAAITAPANVYLHVGDDGGSYAENLTVANTAATGIYSEGLEASAVGGAGGAVTGASGTTGDIAAGGSDDTSLSVTFSTNAASTGGEVAVAETSDGAGIDSLGTTSLGTVDVAVGISVNNYATAAVEKLGGDGSLTPSGVANTYTLDLGSTYQYSSALTADLGALNAAAGPAADVLNGSFNISGDSEFADTGFSNFTGISFGSAAGNNDVVLNTGTIGTFTQQVTLDPTGSNPSGFSGALAAETIDVVGTILAVPPPPPPPLPVATVWGDVHITTFDGLYYNFQAEGEFVLAESTVAGDSFQVQGRMEPYSEGATVSVLTMLAAEVGTDRVTFGLNRTDVVSVNGTQEAMGIGTTIALSGGTLTQTSSTGYQLTWNTGEVMQVTDAGSYLNMNLTLSSSDGPGSVEGLLGGDTGQANDFQLPDGTVLAQPLSSADLYGEFADAWRVTSGAGGNSLMDYAPGQGTAAFTDLNFPTDSIGVSDLPAAIAQEAELEVQEAGITDPNLAAAAVIDLLVTGDPTALLNDLNVNQTGETTSAAVITSPPPPIPALGISANASNVIETAGGTTDVTFTAYLTTATGTDTVIDWAVTAPSASYLSAAALGGSFPSGFVVIPAGQTTAQFTVSLPEGVLGSLPSSDLQVSISSTNGDPVFGQVAQTEIDNYTPEPGNPAIAQLSLLSGAGTFSGSDGNYTLNVGTLVAGESPVQDRFQIANVALAPSDLLTGSIAASGSGFTVYGTEPLTPLSAGANYQGLVTEATSGQTGAQSETVVFTPVDENITGYSSIQASQTVAITDTVLSPAIGDLLTGGPVNLGTFYQGDVAETTLSIENAAASGAAGLDVTTSASGDATAGGAITELAPGGTNDASVVAGIDTSSPGVKTGYVTVDYTSDAGDGNTASAGSQQIEVEGTVYGPAVAALSAAPIYVHPGDDDGSVVVPITVSNTGTTNGYAENLIATVFSFGSPVTSASGSVIDLAPGLSNDIALSATLADASYGTYSGEVAVTLESDGSGIDSNGTTSLGIGFVQATVNVDQYAVAAIEQTGGDGTLTPTGVAAAYALNLGVVAQYSTPLGASLAVLNDVLGTADDLEGGFSISGAPEFTNTGFGAFGPGAGSPGLGAGQTDSQPIIVLSSGTVGVFTETITLDPADYNPSGYQAGLTPETVTVTGTVVAAPPPTPEARVADAWGDVHLTTFDGLYYNFMAAGEFVLTESTVPGDSFAIQARMQPWNGSSSVSVNTMIAAQVGNDRVTFGIDRADVVWIDGAGVSLSGTPVVTLADGTLEQTSADSYRLVWNTGEELDITDDGSYLNATVSLPASDEGNVQGLLGNDAGNPADDLTLPGGTPIAAGGTITYAELYGTYAASWEVSDSTSLMDYGPGQNAASFFNANFPYNQIGLGNLPANAVQQALAAAEAAGITDPNLQEAAIIDYLFTGNPDALQASENVQQQEGTGTTTGQTLTEAPPPAAVAGVQANEATEVESTTGAEAVGFTVYLTSPEAQNVVIDYAVSADPGAGFIAASEIGDPSGAVTIEAGATSAVFTVALPPNVLGSAAYEDLQVVISPQDPPEQGVFAPLAQTEILNTGPTEGNPAQALLDQLSGDGSLTGSDTAYVLNLGTVEQFANPLEAGWGVANGAIAPADLLSGSFVVNGSTQFLNNGLATFAPLAAGNADTAPAVELLTNQVGTFTETVTLSPTDSNATGFSAAMNTVTLEVTGTVVAPPSPPPPPVPEATSWGDVHITTFDGVYYNFQAAGEYVLTRSTVAGDTFQVQARLQPWTSNSSVTVQTQVGAAIGSDDVVFALTGAGLNDSPLYLNGTAEALGVGQTLSLSDGSVTESSANTYLVNWDTGESMTVTLDGSYISDTIELTAADAGDVQGLLGPDDGNPSTDLQLPDGQSIALNGTIASADLYGVYATDWQVPNTASSLLYYTAGQSPSAFLIPGFPEDALALSQLPANLVAAAEAIVEAEGITNPNLIDAAVIDLLVTGNPNSVFSTENVQEEGVLLSSAAVSIPTPLPSVGIMADSTSVLEPTTGTLAVDYTIYLTAAAAQTSTIDYNVISAGPNNLGTNDIVGGTGSGSVQIDAGQTSVQISVDVLANALGSQPVAELEVGITPTGGESLFGGTAETEIVNPTPTAGNPAVALVEQLGGDGTLSGSGTQYELNLGTQEQNGSALWANLGIENGATVPADDLSGQFTITNFTEYLNTGFAPFSSVTPGAADTEPVVSLNTGTIGVFTEQVVLDPTDTNPTGYSATMNDVTLTVTGTIVPMPLPPPPSVPTAVAWGDVHLTTFDGLLYNFQAVGEFTLAKSTVAGDSFNVQIRTQEWSPGASVSVIDQVAAGIGSDAVTFGLVGTSNQPYAVMLNGSQAVFTNGVLTLADGTVTEESPTGYVVHWDSGESLTVSLAGTYIDTTVALAAQDENGNVEGLLGYDTGVDNDFAPVVSGTTITTNQLYYGNGEGIAGNYDSVADLWRVTQANSLLYYANGSDTADYTDLGFPADALQLSDLPTNLQQEGLDAAIQAGITDPQVQQAAALDFIVTGDPDIVVGGQNLEQQGITTTASDVTGATITTAVGVAANNAALVEPSSGNLAVGFTVYLTQAEAQATTVDYTVSAPGAGYLGADDFSGDVLPGGSVTIAAGQTSANFSVSVPADALGSLPSGDLQVTITPTGGETVFAPSAQTTIVNNQVETGTPSDPIFALLTGEGTLTDIGNAYTLALGNVALGGTVLSLGLAIENTAGAGSNDLAGTLVDPPSAGFSVSGTGPLPTIAPDTSYQGLHVAVNTGTAGTYSETLTFTPEDQNDSGYSSQQTPLTLTITDAVIASSATLASAGSVTPNPVDFGNARQGATLEQALSVANTATPSAATEALDGSIGAATGAATTNGGSFIGLAAGSTNDTSLVVGVSTTAVGVQSGTATVSLESDGTGIDSNGITPLTSQTIDVVGTVYALAAAQVSPGPLNFGAARLLGTEDLAINVANTAATGGYSEQLLANVLGSSGAISLPADTTGDINAGGSTTLGVVVNTGTAGVIAAGVTLGLYSDGSNVDGFGTLGIGTQTIDVTGTVYREAAARIATPVTFITHVGTTGTASIVVANTAAADGFSENLLANIVGESASITPLATATGDIVAGHSAALGLDISAATAGVISGGVTLDLTSDGTGIDGLGTIGIGSETIAVTGTVYNYATAAVAEGGAGTLSGSGSLYTLNLGTVALGSGLTTATLNLDNIATGVADGLSVASSINALNGVFVNNGFGTLATVAAGQASSTMDVSMGSGTAGTFTETLTFALSSTDSGGSTSLTPITIDVTGSVVAPSGQVFVLTTGTDVVNGGATGSNVVLAGNATLSSGDQINAGSGGDNTLALQGGGVFNLTLPSSITNIETITAQEGQPAAVINGVVYQSEVQTVDLRAGMNNVTVQVLPGTPNPNDPSASSITITGAANNDVIELGSGDDTVTLGQGETVDGGSGSDVILVTATTLSGSVITGGSGHTEMYFTGGGTFAMGSNISNVGSIYLASTTSGWNFTANSVANMVIQDASTATSTITAGGMNQTLTGGAAGKLTMVGDATAGSDTTFKDTAALFNGDTLQNFMAGDLIDVTGLGFSSQGTGAGQTSISLSGGKLNVLVSGVQQTSVTLPGSFVLADFTVGSDGAGGTLIGYHVSPPS